MSQRVLTWNLMHGRAVPPAHRALLPDFASALERWAWDVALLQEVPPWWPPQLAAHTGASWRLVMTSRNGLLFVRRALAERWPDVIKSAGGGCNAILVRGSRSIVEHCVQRLAWLPERRWLHAVRLDSGEWFANLHGGGSLRECRLAAHTFLRWTGEAPAVLGGDFNVHDLALEGFEHAAGQGPDHVFVRGLSVAGGATVLDRGRLSDHAPVLASVGWLGEPRRPPSHELDDGGRGPGG
jgi:endonuclease/exonuclease/phosphatase family metal-dependent hydrolase